MQVWDQAPHRMSELHPSQLSVAAEARMKAGGSLEWCSVGRRCVNQCVESFDGMQVCRDLGDALLVTEWGGWE